MPRPSSRYLREVRIRSPDAMTLSFQLPRQENVHVDIINLAGRRVATLVSGLLDSGDHVIRWDGRTDRGARAPVGAYLVRLRHGSEVRGAESHAAALIQ